MNESAATRRLVWRDDDPATHGNLPDQPMRASRAIRRAPRRHGGVMAASYVGLAFLRHSRFLRRPRQSKQGETQLN